MIILCDKSTLFSSDIEHIIQETNSSDDWKVIVVDSISSMIDIDENEMFRESFFITRGNKKFIFESKNDKRWPVFTIQITETKFWSTNELDIDAKIERIEDFFTRKFVVLLAEERTYNNFINGEYINRPNSNLERSFIVYQTEYSTNTNILQADLWAELLGINKDEYLSSQEGNIYESKVVSMGRYYPGVSFNKGTDLFSTKLIKAKNPNHVSKVFYKELVDYFLSINEPEIFDFVFYVPCKQGKVDRFEFINPQNGLSIINDYGDIKQLMHQEKINTMKGSFDLKHGIDIKDKNILLVDDVITDGATLTVISDLLFDKGVKSVSWLTFAKTHHVPSQDFFSCSECNNYLSFRFNNDQGKWFLGCTNYPECRNAHYDVSFPDLDYIYRYNYSF